MSPVVVTVVNEQEATAQFGVDQRAGISLCQSMGAMLDVQIAPLAQNNKGTYFSQTIPTSGEDFISRIVMDEYSASIIFGQGSSRFTFWESVTMLADVMKNLG